MTYLFALVLSFATFALLRRGLRWLWRMLDERAARQGRLPPFWKARQWITRPLWGYRRGQVFASLGAACFFLWTVLSTASPWFAPPLVLRVDVSRSASNLTHFYGAPEGWLEPTKSSSVEETIERKSVFPFPRLQLTYPSSDASQQHDSGGIIICDWPAEGAVRDCRLNLTTTLRSPLGVMVSKRPSASPSKVSAVFSSDGSTIEAHWHEGLVSFPSKAFGAADFDGGTAALLASGPAPVSRDWMIAATRGAFAPSIITDWPASGGDGTNRYVFAHASEQLLFAAFLSVSELADPSILLNHDLSVLRQNVLRDYATIFGHLDQAPALAALLTAPLPDSNDTWAIAAALARQPQLRHLYPRRDVHAKGVYEKLLADLSASGILQ